MVAIFLRNRFAGLNAQAEGWLRRIFGGIHTHDTSLYSCLFAAGLDVDQAYATLLGLRGDMATASANDFQAVRLTRSARVAELALWSDQRAALMQALISRSPKTADAQQSLLGLAAVSAARHAFS